MDDKTKRIKSKTGVNPTSMREAKAAKARGLQRKIEMSSSTAKPLKPAPGAKRRGTPVPMPKKTLKPGEGQRRPAGPITKKPMAAKSKNSGPVVVLPDGSTVGLKDIGKVKPTPKAVKPKPLPMTPNKEYFKRQKDYLDSLKKKKK